MNNFYQNELVKLHKKIAEKESEVLELKQQVHYEQIEKEKLRSSMENKMKEMEQAINYYFMHLNELQLCSKTLLRSRRWKIGNGMINLMNRLRFRKNEKPKPLKRMERAIDQFNMLKITGQRNRYVNYHDLKQLNDWLKQMEKYMKAFFETWSWRAASVINWVVSLAQGKKQKIIAKKKIETILKRYDHWKPSGNEKADLDQLAKWVEELHENYKSLINSKSWIMGNKLVSAINRILFRKQTNKVRRKIEKNFIAYYSWREESIDQAYLFDLYNLDPTVDPEFAPLKS